MSITSISTELAGASGSNPRLIKIVTTDALSMVCSVNYLNSSNAGTFNFVPSDMFEITTADFGTALFSIKIIDGNSALVFYAADDVIGDVSAGANGTAGAVISYPAMMNGGTLELMGASISNNSSAIITNCDIAQNTTYILPDPSAESAQIVVANNLVAGNIVTASGNAGVLQDGGAKIISGLTSVYSGGSITNVYDVAGLNPSSVGSASIYSSQKLVAIAKAVAGQDILSITFTSDPGAGTVVSYLYTTTSLSA